MLHQLVDSPGDHTGSSLYAAYRRALAEKSDQGNSHPIDTDTDNGTEPSGMTASGSLTLSDAASIVAAAENDPNAETVAAEARDHLLLGMTTAVLDVEAVAANIDLDLSPREVQQRIEGRTTMTLEEFAHIHALIASRQQ